MKVVSRKKKKLLTFQKMNVRIVYTNQKPGADSHE